MVLLWVACLNQDSQDYRIPGFFSSGFFDAYACQLLNNIIMHQTLIPVNAKRAFIPLIWKSYNPGECLNGIHTVDLESWFRQIIGSNLSYDCIIANGVDGVAEKGDRSLGREHKKTHFLQSVRS